MNSWPRAACRWTWPRRSPGSPPGLRRGHRQRGPGLRPEPARGLSAGEHPAVDAAPSSSPLLLKAALRRRCSVASLGPASARPAASSPTRARCAGTTSPSTATTLARVRAGLRLPAHGRAPGTYPHLLAFPLHLALMTDAGVPVRRRWARCTSATRSRSTGRSPSTSCSTSPCRPTICVRTARGRMVDAGHRGHRRRARSCWRGARPCYLRAATATGRPRATAPARGRPGSRRRAVRVAAPADLGRRYAAVSGDRNPIHLSTLTAKAFGFPRRSRTACGPRPAAWPRSRAAARGVSRRGRLPQADRRCPGTVSFGARKRDGHLDFGVSDARLGRSGSPATGSIRVRSSGGRPKRIVGDRFAVRAASRTSPVRRSQTPRSLMRVACPVADNGQRDVRLPNGPTRSRSAGHRQA